MGLEGLKENELWDLLENSIAKKEGNGASPSEREYRNEINNRIISLKTGVDYSKIIYMKANTRTSTPITLCQAMGFATKMAISGKIKNDRSAIMGKASEIMENPEILKNKQLHK